ncbi:MAG: phosphoenolpyruvate--protein phosphotransferase [Candidatus Omnitrophica bacterium]|nr:phosphoenolpyruvate--protein phosphotransferase [Candidatus Omnitrophota bacterium]MDE2231272.1 phosphoenolpyruvate--protein phosphotransferase [Candidatus Omnitrophota bacterium]
MSEIVLKGIPAAPGIAYGPSFILDKGEFIVPKRSIATSEVNSEIARFEEAVHNARLEIQALKTKITKDMGAAHARIFDAHLLVLQDATLIDQVTADIRKHKTSAEYVFIKIIKKFVEAFTKLPDEYLRERAADVSDISRRVLKYLMDESKLHDLELLQDDLIVVAHELSPSDAVSMYNKKIKGFLTDIGGRTSHTAIIAKSLGVPAVVGLKDATLKIDNQDPVIVDGQKGLVIINPSHETKEQYIKEQHKITATLEKLDDLKNLPAQTLDGKNICIMANLELSSEIPVVRKYGAEGVGLYRTEFLYMNRLDLPSEEEQYQAYSQVARAVAPCPVTIRTLDLGGDKFISSVQIPHDMTPFLGCRAIRFCLERPDIFKTQLRAILRASVHGRIQMMYPMICGLGELRQANAILNEVRTSLKDEKIPFDEKMKVGIMIEVPSAVMTAEALARETDFFSIGTNDLIQYTLAVDRVNEKTAHLYEPTHPAVIKMIQKTIDAGHNEGLHVALCGEMASDPLLAFLLLGMGIDELSMSAASILTVKRMIRGVKLQDAQRTAYEAMQLATGQEVEEYIDVQIRRHMTG